MPENTPENIISKPIFQKPQVPTYDWNALKVEFLKGPWRTAEDYRKYKKIWSKNNGAFRLHSVGWAKEKKELLDRALARATNNLVNAETRNVEKTLIRQSNLARWLQLKGASALKDLDPETTEDARKLIVSGLQEERAALSAGGKIAGGGGGGTHLTQVNVNLPKTNFDELTKNMSYEELLEFIAELRREKARRTGTAVITAGEAETDGSGV